MNVKFFLLFGLLLMLTYPLSLSAQSNTTHTIKKGETLFSIAQKYNVEVDQLKKWNGITASQLAIGNTLVIKKTAEAEQSSISDDAQTHTVQASETLFSISKKYQITIAELKSWNDLASNNLQVGQALKIFPPETEAQPEKSSIDTNKQTQENTYYVVKNNDSLYGIARKHTMSVDQLKKLNDLASNTIRVGQKLTVSSSSAPPSVSSSSSSAQGQFMNYTIKEGNVSISEFIEKFEMDEEEFRALNTGLSSSTLRRGQDVTVLAPSRKKFKNPYLKNNSSISSLGTISVTHYGGKKATSTTTSGELYNPDALTGAHASISLGSVIFVQSPNSRYGVFVRINDRISSNELKLSTAAWKALHFSGERATATIYQNK